MSRGVVVSGTGGIWVVVDETGAQHEASLRGKLKQGAGLKLAVGDDVELERGERDDAWTIGAILPRRSRLVRRAPGNRPVERVVAANVDQVIVVFAAAQPDPHEAMLDRFLAIAEANALSARVVVNKVELVGEAAARRRFQRYADIGYPLHLTSALERIGLEELHEALLGVTSVLSGPSGVGKSSLMNIMYPTLALRVGAISESVNKGRHTTVGAFLHPLPDGGAVVDTPGLREVGMWGIPSSGLDACFAEFRPLIPECRFGDCRHLAEPDCAVRAAVASGAIAPERYESYRRLRAELEEAERRW